MRHFLITTVFMCPAKRRTVIHLLRAFWELFLRAIDAGLYHTPHRQGSMYSNGTNDIEMNISDMDMK